ncbi:MAG: D-2-hydroxyacid dehydrogenase [Chloroflexota bacterium]
MTHILVTAPFSSDLIDSIQSVSREVTVEQMNISDGKWPQGKLTEAEIIYTNSDLPSADLAPNLRWVQSHWTSIDSLRNHPIWNSETIITTSSGINSTNITQHVFSKLLYFANKGGEWRRFHESGGWPAGDWDRFLPIELRGKTLGLLGYGSLAREIARVATVFGMHVLVTKRNLKKTSESGFRLEGTGDPNGDFPLRIYPPEATKSMVSECDFVVVSLPLTKETLGFVDSSLFKSMKSSAYLINVSDGKVIVEEDLINAVNKGWIAGVGIDNFAEEPLPSSSPLWAMPNVIMSPGVAGLTKSYNKRVVGLFCENIRRYLVGEPLLNIVNREQGY